MTATSIVHGRRTALMVMLMTIPIALAVVPVTAVDGEANGAGRSTVWGVEGSVDTGWMRINATGADPSQQTSASGHIELPFAPSVDVSNLSFEVRVNGSQGISVQEPVLSIGPQYTQVMNLGRGIGLGETMGLKPSDPYNGRVTGVGDSGSYWMLPPDVEITDLVIEAMRPADPYVSLAPFEFKVSAHAQHPVDGRLWLSIENLGLLTFDQRVEPPLVNIEANVQPTSMVVNQNTGDLLAIGQQGELHVWQTDDMTKIDVGTVTPPQAGQGGNTQILIMYQLTNGRILGFAEYEMCALNIPANPNGGMAYSWDCNTPLGQQITAPEVPTTVLEKGGILYVGSTEGVSRYDISTGQAMSSWNTQNWLPNNDVTDIIEIGGVMYIGTNGGGVARVHITTQNWLATWTTSDYLDSDTIIDLSVLSGDLVIVNSESIQAYDVSAQTFNAANLARSALGLGFEIVDTFEWGGSGVRGPAVNTLLVTDGAGRAMMIDPFLPLAKAGELTIGTAPLTEDLEMIASSAGILWVVSGSTAERFDTNNQRWMSAMTLSGTANDIAGLANGVAIGTQGNGLLLITNSGIQYDVLNSAAGGDNNIRHVVHDSGTGYVVSISNQGRIRAIDPAQGMTAGITSREIWNSEIDAAVTDVTANDDVLYIGTEQNGVLRYSMVDGTALSPWVSTGIDYSEYIPVDSDGNMLYIGLFGYGVLRYEMANKRFLSSWEFTQTGGGQGPPNQGTPSPFITSLEVLSSGSLVIGTFNGGWAQTGTNSWAPLTGQQRPPILALTSDSTSIWAGTDNDGVCEYSLANYQAQNCIDQSDGLPSDTVLFVENDGSDLLVGLEGGAAIIDKSTSTVTSTWEKASSQTELVTSIEDNGIIYTSEYSRGIHRYDTVNKSWLPTWNDSFALLDDDRIRVFIPDPVNAGFAWVAGEFGVHQIDLRNGIKVMDWNRGSNGQQSIDDTVTHFVIANGIAYIAYTQSQSFFGLLDRVAINNQTALSPLTPTTQFGQWWEHVIRHIDIVDSNLWVGVSTWQGRDGGMVKYDSTTGAIVDVIEAVGSVDGVKTLTLPSGEYMVAYNDHMFRHLDASGGLIATYDRSQTIVEIRTMKVHGDIVYFATDDGITRYDHVNRTWLSTWTASNVFAGNGEDVRSLEIIDSILYVGRQYWYGGAIDLIHPNGTTVTTIALTQNGQRGIATDFVKCGSDVFASINRIQWDRQSRLRLMSIGLGATTNINLPNNEQTTMSALACDDSDTVLVGSNSGLGVLRYSTTNQLWYGILDENSGIAPTPIANDAMTYWNGTLYIGHSDDGGGGLSQIPVNGSNVGTGMRSMEDIPVTSLELDNLGSTMLMGRPGGISGQSTVETLRGMFTSGVVDEYLYLASGYVTSISGNATEVYLLSGWVEAQQGILRAKATTNGTLEIILGRNVGQFSDPDDIKLTTDGLYISFQGNGLQRYDPVTGSIAVVQGTIHDGLGFMTVQGDKLAIGLVGTENIVGGQVWNLTTRQWDGGAILPDMPGDLVLGMVEHDNMYLFATNGGLGMWNISASSWMTAMTKSDGLLDNYLTSIQVFGGDVWVGTVLGVMRLDPANRTVLGTVTQGSGLPEDAIGSMVISQTTGGNQTLIVGQPGLGFAPPTASIISPSGSVLDTALLEQIPSNDVTAIASDRYGVHVATGKGPLVHWTQGNGFEYGLGIFDFDAWPIMAMYSDGTHLIVSTQGLSNVVDARQYGPVTALPYAFGAEFTANTVWLLEADGLHGYSPSIGWNEISRLTLRRAEPLVLEAFGYEWLLGDNAVPDQPIRLVGQGTDIASVRSSNVTVFNTEMGGVPVTYQNAHLFAQNGAAFWISSVSGLFSGQWNLTELDNRTLESFSEAVDMSPLRDSSRILKINLASPSNGSLEVRLIYDWVSTEPPAIIIDAWDRPADGGGALLVKWAETGDPDVFASYEFFLEQGTEPSFNDLDLRQPDYVVTNSRLTMLDELGPITTADGAELIDDTPTWVIMRIRSIDGSAEGRLGTPSPIFGPVNTTDEIPASPKWGDAYVPDELLLPGDIMVSWAQCLEIDVTFIGIRLLNEPFISDVSTIELFAARPAGAANSTKITLSDRLNKPTWLALTCIDEAGQEATDDPLILGPVIPSDLPPDETPPQPLADLKAYDTSPDDGGSITLTWTATTELDCAFIAFGAIPVSEQAEEPNMNDFEIINMVDTCEVKKHYLISILGERLDINETYWVSAWAVDTSLNEGRDGSTIYQVTAGKELAGTYKKPDRIEWVEVIDTPDDLGGSLTVTWEPSDDEAFWNYIVWVAEHPIDDVSSLYTPGGGNTPVTNPNICGCYYIRTVSALNGEPNSLEVNVALSGGNSLMTAKPDLIKQNHLYYVSVTVHDIQDDVWLDDLATDSAVAIDNINDVTPPDRLPAPDVRDRAMDHGEAIQFMFDASDASDLSHYHVYADIEPITDITGFEPVLNMTIGTEGEWHDLFRTSSPLDREFQDTMEVFVTVVAVDTRGNFHAKNLDSTGTIVIDDAATLPEVQIDILEWVEQRGALAVRLEWSTIENSNHDGWRIFVSDEPFEVIPPEAIVINRSTPQVTLSAQGYELDSNVSWYFAVVYVNDDGLHRIGVVSEELAPYNATTQSSDPAGSSVTRDQSAAIATVMNNLQYAAGLLAALVLLGLLMTVRRRRKGRSDPWGQAGVWSSPEETDLWADEPPLMEGIASDSMMSYDDAPPMDVESFAAPVVTTYEDPTFYAGAEETMPMQQTSIEDPYNMDDLLDMGFLDDIL